MFGSLNTLQSQNLIFSRIDFFHEKNMKYIKVS